MSGVSNSERVNISSQCSDRLLRLSAMTSSTGRIVDQRQLALRLEALDDLRVVLVGLRQAGDHVDLADGRCAFSSAAQRLSNGRSRDARPASRHHCRVSARDAVAITVQAA